jgi:hypothetical protein
MRANGTNDAAGSAGPGAASTRIKKGITLRVQVYVEGEDEPANDFSKVGQAFVTQVLTAGMKGYAGPYTLAVQKIEPLEGSDGSDEG